MGALESCRLNPFFTTMLRGPLPPFKHTRNPALEKEDEFHGSVASSAPLITHNGVVEKRPTTDRKLIRSQPAHSDVEFEYLPMFSSSSSTIGSSKSKASRVKVSSGSQSNHERSKDENDYPSAPNEERKIDKSTNDPDGLRNEIKPPKDEINVKNDEGGTESSKKNHDNRRLCKPCKFSVKRNSNASPKSNASSDSLTSRKSAKSALTESSVASTVRNINVDKRQHGRRVSSNVDFRYVANGLDEEDQFPHRRF